MNNSNPLGHSSDLGLMKRYYRMLDRRQLIELGNIYKLDFELFDYDQYMRNNQTDITTSISLTRYADLSAGQKNFNMLMKQ